MVGCLLVTTIDTLPGPFVGQDPSDMAVADPKNICGITFLKVHYPAVNRVRRGVFCYNFGRFEGAVSGG